MSARGREEGGDGRQHREDPGHQARGGRRHGTFEKDDLDHPEELVAALKDAPGPTAGFGALTPAARRSWVLHLTQARQSATRISRLRKARAKILGGEGFNHR
ncbi:hypothetical protein HC022_23260 [Salipiger sp. HF18]|uniref:YdeI/OmpD-associated family protein n=1 Tax=Salipiger sp. HF18 TaxID=2721557 RepID=UPI00142D920A|nr:YdeI/OmpD-associated family protein [Salipiger sp. HF18]NIY99030.1 hypothetical protein [Salipiger sp. HF18]